MQRALFTVGHRFMWLCLAAVAAVGWSCTKEDHLYGDSSPQSEGAIAQARSFYERTAAPLTKSIGGQSVAVKPLPGEITPLWDKAAATVFADGTTAWVDVPIEATVVYTAVRNGFHAHEAGDSCGHDHSPVQAVQKLTVHTDADGTQRSLIATIVPEADCTAELNGFSSAEGLDGFSGFVSWHDLTGKLVRVAEYENGVRTRSAEPTGENEKDIIDIVDDAVLYPDTSVILRFNPNEQECRICREYDCPAKNKLSQHCNVCGRYDPTTHPEKSKCTCARCSNCGFRLKGDYPTCICPEDGSGTPSGESPKFCIICGRTDCNGKHPDLVPTPPYIVQETILTDILSKVLTKEQFEGVKNGSYAADSYPYQSESYEFIHGLYIGEETRSEGHAQMRQFFIHNAQAFVYHGSYYHLGMALHPIIDTYILVQTRIDMLSFASYRNTWNIVDGRFIIPYTSDPAPCTKAITYIYEQLSKLSGSDTYNTIGAVFDGWLKQTGGGY